MGIDNSTLDIFISYSRSDFYRIALLIRRLNKKGYSVWLDQWRILAGDNFQVEYHAGIESASLIILFASNSSLVSYWVNDEISRAVRIGKPILVAELEQIEVYPIWMQDIKNVKYVSCVDNSDYSYEIFFKTVHLFFPSKAESFDVFSSDYKRVSYGESAVLKDVIDAAENGDPSAQGILAQLYLVGGDSVSKNFDKAEYWLKRAAANKNAFSEYNLGLFYLYKNDTLEAYYWFRRSGFHGYSDANVRIAYILKSGEGVLDDKELALRILESTKSDNPLVLSLMSELLIDKGDIKRGIDYLKEASYMKDPGALFNLGLLYANGQYVEHNYEKAFQLFEMSSSLGFLMAQSNVGDMLIRGLGVSQDLMKGFSLLNDSAQKGDSGGQYNLGWYYFKGEYIKRDLLKACYWWERAFNNGFILASEALGQCYYSGYGVARDCHKAFYFWSIGAQHKYANSQYGLGLLYLYGEGVQKNKEIARAWFNMAHNGGHVIPEEIIRELE